MIGQHQSRIASPRTKLRQDTILVQRSLSICINIIRKSKFTQILRQALFRIEISDAVGMMYDRCIKVKLAALPLAQFQLEAPKPDPNRGAAIWPRHSVRATFRLYLCRAARPHLPQPLCRIPEIGLSRASPRPKTRATLPGLCAGARTGRAAPARPEEAPVLMTPEIRFAGTGEARVARAIPEYRTAR